MSILRTGAAVLYMKVGTHAQEGLDDIIARKQKEIEQSGFAMWGYGGNTCHPLSIVRPFAEDVAERGGVIHLIMEPMESKHFAEQIAADEYSIDMQTWHDIDTSVHRVLGSRYALFIKHLRRESLQLRLDAASVALGPSEGKRADGYIRGRVDKACLILGESTTEPEKSVTIGLVAEIVKPYAAVLRNRV